MTTPTVIQFLGALIGGHRPNATSVSAENPLPVQGGTADNSPIGAANNGGNLVGGVMNATSGGATTGIAARLGVLTLDLARRLIIKPLGHSVSHLAANVSTNGTTNVILFAGVASQRMDIQQVTIANRDTVAHTFDLIDNATIVQTVIVGPGLTEVLTFPAGLPNAAANTAWNVVLRAAHTTNPVVVSASGYRTTA